ncbi:hypothetical protein ANCCAN_08826 [Ancylostoma caninum]|uniref:Uncharacterized protein n=1 Tax=Ancylostoma caninum TaxID=29170 RepID=A0A368GPD4_ANCCA|nr:hypothetical protein ANCCAN_08826 [Ancylostoma caninum]
MTTVIFLFTVISTALACFRQPSLSNPLPGFHQPLPSHPLPGFRPPSLAHPPHSRKPLPATSSTTTASPVLGVVIFVLRRPWPSDQSEVTKYVSDFNNELRLHAKKQGIPFERFGQPVATKKSGKITVDYYLRGTDIACEKARPIFFEFSTDIAPKSHPALICGLLHIS